MQELKAKRYVLYHAINVLGDESLTTNDIKTVWLSKTLQNWKGVFVVRPEDRNGLLYEVTYNGDQQEYYVDVYNKIDNIKYKIS